MAMRLDHGADELEEVHGISVTRSAYEEGKDTGTFQLIRLPPGLPLGGQRIRRSLRSLLFSVAMVTTPAAAQDPGTLNPEPLPPLPNPISPTTPAKELFARKTTPLSGPPRAIGSYADGCLAGAVALPTTGSTWQVMRVSRNRYWGHPSLVAFIERFAEQAKTVVWNGLLVGDMSQPRGGPMLSGHSSHQIGLDVDIWFTPMPDHELSPEQREFNMALNMVAKDRRKVDPNVWTRERTAIVRAAAQDPVVTRIFVNAAIKKAMCREAGSDRTWLSKVRPWWGHDEHFHIRIACPSNSSDCKPQPPVSASDGCGHELDPWFKEAALHWTPPPASRHSFPLAAMPSECRNVAKAP